MNAARYPKPKALRVAETSGWARIDGGGKGWYGYEKFGSLGSARDKSEGE